MLSSVSPPTAGRSPLMSVLVATDTRPRLEALTRPDVPFLHSSGGDSGMVGGEVHVGEAEEGPFCAEGEKSRDCLMGSESARRNGLLLIDLGTWTTLFFGVNID